MSRRSKAAPRPPTGASDAIDEASFTYLVLGLPIPFVWFAWVASRTVARRPMASVPLFWFMLALTQVASALVVFNGRGTTRVRPDRLARGDGRGRGHHHLAVETTGPHEPRRRRVTPWLAIVPILVVMWAAQESFLETHRRR